MAKKTTVLLREDVYQALKARAGSRNISHLLNQILLEYLAKGERMFGTKKPTDLSDLKDHRDRL